MERYAKAITVLVLGLVTVLLDKAGVQIPGETLEQAIYALVTASLVWLVPNRPA